MECNKIHIVMLSKVCIYISTCIPDYPINIWNCKRMNTAQHTSQSSAKYAAIAGCNCKSPMDSILFSTMLNMISQHGARREQWKQIKQKAIRVEFGVATKTKTNQRKGTEQSEHKNRTVQSKVKLTSSSSYIQIYMHTYIQRQPAHPSCVGETAIVYQTQLTAPQCTATATQNANQSRRRV